MRGTTPEERRAEREQLYQAIEDLRDHAGPPSAFGATVVSRDTLRRLLVALDAAVTARERYIAVLRAIASGSCSGDVAQRVAAEVLEAVPKAARS